MFCLTYHLPRRAECVYTIHGSGRQPTINGCYVRGTQATTGYHQAIVGQCPSGERGLSTEAECVTAAKALAKTDTTVDRNSVADLPDGCYYKQSVNRLYFNHAGDTSSSDTDRVSLCATTGGTSSSPVYMFANTGSSTVLHYQSSEADEQHGMWIISDGVGAPHRAHVGGHFRPLTYEDGAPRTGWYTVEDNVWAEELSVVVHGKCCTAQRHPSKCICDTGARLCR